LYAFILQFDCTFWCESFGIGTDWYDNFTDPEHWLWAVQLIVIFCTGIYRTNLAAAGGMPTSPELIRMEVAITQTDFNTRLKQVTNFYQYFPLFLYIS
jgi:hypothetical protein